MELTHANIDTVIRDCLFTNDEVPDYNNPPEFVQADGVRMKMAFHPGRLEGHRDDVRSMLAQLSDEFMHDKGGGMSMLKMPFTKDGTQYGEQHDADALFMLGTALGLAAFTMPRDMWSVLPGGLPYITVTL